QSVASLGTVLTHHDNRCLHRSQAGEDQIKQYEWIRVERACREHDAVDADPDENHCPKHDQKFPAAAELGDLVGESLAKREFPFELFNDVARKNLMLFQAFDDLLVERGKLAELVFQNFLHVILPKLAQIFEADERFAVEVRHFLFDELEQRRPNQFGDHSVVWHLRLFTNVADQWCGAHRDSLPN